MSVDTDGHDVDDDDHYVDDEFVDEILDDDDDDDDDDAGDDDDITSRTLASTSVSTRRRRRRRRHLYREDTTITNSQRREHYRDRYQSFLRCMVSLSFVLATLAVTWFGTMQYTGWNKHKKMQHSSSSQHSAAQTKDTTTTTASSAIIMNNSSSTITDGNDTTNSNSSISSSKNVSQIDDSNIDNNTSGASRITKDDDEHSDNDNDNDSSGEGNGGGGGKGGGGGNGNGKGNGDGSGGGHGGGEEEEDASASTFLHVISMVSMIIYSTGSCWWIVTGTFIYLSPLVFPLLDRIACCYCYCCGSNSKTTTTTTPPSSTSILRDATPTLTMRRNRRDWRRGSQESLRGEGIWNCVSSNDDNDEDSDDDDDDVNNELLSPSSSTASFLHRFIFYIYTSRPRLPTIQPWRIILFGFVLLPSVWVYLYGTYTGIPRSKRMIQLSSSSSSTTNHDHEHNDGESTESTSVLDWIIIILYASANPSGTAGMVAMGIYVFGTVGKHCPLWSSSIVLPKTNSKSTMNTKTKTNTNHLLKDALRLHQWSGYISFVWILIHTVLYLLIYGVMGLMRSQTPEQEQPPNDPSKNEQQSWSSSLVWIFLQSASQAVIPPAQCRPWYHNTTTTTATTTNTTSDTDTNATDTNSTGSLTTTSIIDHHHYHDLRVLLQYFQENGTTVAANATAGEEEHHEQQQQQHHHGSSCYGYYRNFYGFLGTVSFLLLVLTSITWVRRYKYRFFYGSHMIFASLFILGTILHMKRNIVYILPSIICYMSTTIPTLLQHANAFIPSLSSLVSLFGYRKTDDRNSNNNDNNNGGVTIEEYKLVSFTSKSKNTTTINSNDSANDNCDTNIDHTTSNGTDDKDTDNDGCDCVELTFSVDHNLLPRRRALIEEENKEDHDGYRPQSVKICVPSISLLWYPFTIIETTTTMSGGNDGNDDDDDDNDPRPRIKPVLQIKILMQRAGYFTTTLLNQFKRLNEEERNKDHENLQRHHRRISNIENGNGNSTENGVDFDVDVGGHSSDSSSYNNNNNTTDDDDDNHNNNNNNSHHHEEKEKMQPPRAVMPLILVDGFYSGTSDWIGNAFTHDVVLIAAGGIGVTPFLTFLPILLQHLIRSSSSPPEQSSGPLKTVSFLWCCRDEALIQHVLQAYLLPLFQKQQQQQNGLFLDDEEGTTGGRCLAPNDGTTVHDPLSSDDTPNNEDDDHHNVISIPTIRFQLLIYNTSRNRDDHDDISLCPDDIGSSNSSSSCSIQRDIFRDEIVSEEDQNLCNEEYYRRRTGGICGGSCNGDGSSGSNGNPMQPSKAYHNPSSSSTTVVIACISFLSISVVGMVLHYYLYLHYILENTHSFSVRPYGLIAILIVSIVVGVIVDKLWRCCWFVSSSSSSSITRRCKNGYTRTVTELNTSELPLPDEGDDSNITSHNDDNHNNNDNSNDTIFCENDGTQNRTEFVEVRSLSPGKPIRQLISTTRSVKKVLLELEISNGRPVLFDDNSTIINNDGDEDEDEDDDEDSNNTGPSTNATAYTTIATTTTQPTVATTTMKNVAIAQNPGVFYCGTTGLLDRIKFGVNNIQQQRRRQRTDNDDDDDDDDAADTNNKGPVNDCVYYEESFEM